MESNSDAKFMHAFSENPESCVEDLLFLKTSLTGLIPSHIQYIQTPVSLGGIIIDPALIRF
jgi:hypothetical protein